MLGGHTAWDFSLNFFHESSNIWIYSAFYDFFTKMRKKQLLNELIRAKVLNNPLIIKAFEKVDRADFVLPEFSDAAYLDQPLPIGFKQTISQPLTVALMLEWLAPRAGEKILDIGCGSGWVTALLSIIVGRKGKVIGIERVPELAEFAKINIAKYPVLCRISAIVQGNGATGYGKEAPFDRIIAAASAKEISLSWKEQLKIGGRIVAPVRNSIIIIDKISEKEYQQTEYWGFAFVSLIND